MHYQSFAIFSNFSLTLASFAKNVVLEHPRSYDADLTNFVTRPEIKVPILDVIEHQLRSTAPGYFFVAPYGRYFQEDFPSSYYQPCQTGPTIYDEKGDLVWTGACEFSNHNTADFRPIFYNGTWHLSAVYTGLDVAASWKVGIGSSNGHGFILNNSYRQESIVTAPMDADNFIPREFLIAEDGQSAISILSKVEYVDVSMVEGIERDGGWVVNMGFREVEIATGESRFEWWALGHIPFTESVVNTGESASSLQTAWNFFDLNSVDKSDRGDYLVSSWQTGTIYSISARNGSINWRLGGNRSTFTHDFSFSGQRDARFLSHQKIQSMLSLESDSDDETEYLSLIANLANPLPADLPSPPSHPSALIISLSHSTKSARIIHQLPRADTTLPLSHGNAHPLSSPNDPNLSDFFVFPGGDAPATLHLPNGTSAVSARFRSDRFVTYRFYRSPFVAFPDEAELALECSAYGTSRAKATTVCHVSWNGATEVTSWRFWAGAGPEEWREWGSFGKVEKKGFESRIMRKGYVPFVTVEGLDDGGGMWGGSRGVEVRVLQVWGMQRREGDGGAATGEAGGKLELKVR